MVNDIYRYMNIPQRCLIEKTIFKKMFYENSTMNSSDRQIFKNYIEKITLKYSLKEELINIPAFNDDELNYDEIEILEVSLNDDRKYARICEIIQKAIPYPMVIIVTYNNKIMINTAYKRISKSDSEKNTVENFIYSNWIDMSNMNNNQKAFINDINMNKLSLLNMYKLYNSFVEKVQILNVSNIGSNYTNLENVSIDKIIEIQNKIKKIDSELLKLNLLIEREQQINRIVDLNMKIKKLEIKRHELIKRLSIDK